jgi:hypothetical protein
MRQRVIRILTLLIALLAMSRTARADNVGKLIRDLEGSDDYKVRLSAAASLAKLGDSRAIEPLITALAEDGEKTVRGAAAVALGKVVTADTDSELMAEARDALDDASKKANEKDSFVRKQAAKALKKVKKAIAAAEDGGGDSGGGEGIYVHIDEMQATIDEDGDTLASLMKKTTEKTLSKNAPDFATGKEPKSASKFYVGGTVTSVSAKAKGSAMIVTCKISMQIASWPKKSLFGFLDGKASVEASDDASDIALAKKDCVAAVVEDLTIKKIIPTIKAKAGG